VIELTNRSDALGRAARCPQSRRATIRPHGHLAALVGLVAFALAGCTGEIGAVAAGDPDDGSGDLDVPHDPGTNDAPGGTPDDGPADDPGAGPSDDGGGPISTAIEGPGVLPHVQDFADAACGAVDSCHPSTYDGHQPVAARALDNLVSDEYGQYPSDDNALGDTLAAWALAHQAEFGIWYVIWRQRINYGEGWENMEDRGSLTENHYDHVHVSFWESP
jgi:hypothetical protein